MFPNLKKLSLSLHGGENNTRRETLSSILPFVPGLKSLELIVECDKNSFESYTLLSDITKLSDLEDLSLRILCEVESSKLFLNQLPTCCPKLRVLEIGELIKNSFH